MKLSPAGDWRLAVTVRTSDIDVATVVFEDITAGTALGTGPAPDTSSPQP